MTLRIGCIVGITASLIITALLCQPLQPLAYHDPADQAANPRRPQLPERRIECSVSRRGRCRPGR